MTPTEAERRFETIWSELRLLLDWHDGFMFCLVFGDDHRVSERLRQRIADFTQTRTRPLRWLKPEQRDTLVETVLRAVLPQGEDGRDAELRAPLWLQLTVAPDDPGWDQARRQVLAALNQRRSELEHTWPRPVFLQLPLAMAADVVVWAPDLWSIRHYIALLPTDPAHARTEDAIAPERLRTRVLDLDRIGADELEAGRLDAALTAFRESLDLCRRLHQTLGDTPQTLRDLSISLNRIGEAERKTGRLDAALTAFRESLDLRRRLHQTLGDTPPTLRDLTYILDRLADAEQAAGHASAAEIARNEHRDTQRRLDEQLNPASPADPADQATGSAPGQPRRSAPPEPDEPV